MLGCMHGRTHLGLLLLRRATLHGTDGYHDHGNDRTSQQDSQQGCLVRVVASLRVGKLNPEGIRGFDLENMSKLQVGCILL